MRETQQDLSKSQESYWYHYVYDVSKLSGYHNFEAEHKMTISGETNYKQIIRKTMLAV